MEGAGVEEEGDEFGFLETLEVGAFFGGGRAGWGGGFAGEWDLSERAVEQSAQSHSFSSIWMTEGVMGRSWQCWCQGVLQPSQKTIWLDLGEWPRPQFMHTAASPGLRRLGLAFLVVGGVSVPAVGVLRIGRFKEEVGKSRTTGEKVLAWVMRRPELVWARRLNSSEASVSSFSLSSSSALFLFFLTMCPSIPAALLPALLPLGRPPRLTAVLAPLGLPPRFTPALLPLGLPPLFLARTGVSVFTPAAAAISSVTPSAPSVLTLGLLPPLPLRPPVFTPPLVILGVGVAPRSWLVTIWLSTDSRAASHSGVFCINAA